jgi:hypothetical protein
VAIVAVVGIIAAVVVATSGGDDDDASDTTVASSEAPTETSGGTDATTGDTADTTTDGTGGGGGEITYPLSITEAQEQGIEVAWDERCDVDRGRLAVPDYFAPPCFAPFSGDNGGATAPGVTGDSIKVVMYQEQEGDPVIRYVTDAITVDDTNQEQYETALNMVEYFQAFFETYGRTVELIMVEGTGTALDAVAARADALYIAEDIKPFMVLGGPALTAAFGEELAARGIPCISCVPSATPEWLADHDPYVWALDASATQRQDHVMEFLEKQVIGKNAEYAGEELQSQPRKFGLVYVESGSQSTELAGRFAASMEAAGAPFAEVLPYSLDPATIQQTAAQVIAKLKASGVTSVVMSVDPVAPREFTKEATAQNYHPEWILAASTLADLNAFARTYDQEQWAHAFGVTTTAARTTPESGGYYYLHKWFTGEEPPAPDTIGTFIPPIATLYGVLQLTGPDLTVENWGAAIWNRIANDRAITQPYLSWGELGYWPQPDYHGIDDTTLLWWDPTATGPDEIRKDGTGMYQFVDGGTRYLPGEWPTEERLFDPEGAVTIYTERPPAEQPPDYPSPAG